MQLKDMIAQANESEIPTIIEACMDRYADLFPDYDFNYFAIPKNTDRNAHIDRVIQMLEGFKEKRSDGT